MFPWLSTSLPTELLDVSEAVGLGLRKGRGGEGEGKWAHPVGDETWSSGWGTSGVLHAFVSHLGGYGYFPPLPYHRVIPGPSLSAYTAKFLAKSPQFLS